MSDTEERVSRRDFVQGALSSAALMAAPAGLDGASASFVEFLYAIA